MFLILIKEDYRVYKIIKLSFDRALIKHNNDDSKLFMLHISLMLFS